MFSHEAIPVQISSEDKWEERRLVIRLISEINQNSMCSHVSLHNTVADLHGIVISGINRDSTCSRASPHVLHNTAADLRDTLISGINQDSMCSYVSPLALHNTADLRGTIGLATAYEKRRGATKEVGMKQQRFRGKKADRDLRKQRLTPPSWRAKYRCVDNNIWGVGRTAP